MKKKTTTWGTGEHQQDGMIALSSVRGGDATVLWQGAGTTTTIAVDDAYVYWADRRSATLQRVPKTGGAVEVVASGSEALRTTYQDSLAVDATSVYFLSTDSGTLSRVDKNGGAPSAIVGGLRCPWLLRSDAGTLVFAIDAIACPDNGNYSDRAIDATTATGGATTRVGDASFAIGGAFALDSKNVYWSGGASGKQGIVCAAR